MDTNENNVMNEIKPQSENKKSNKKIILITTISIVLICIIVSILVITGIFKSNGEKFAKFLTKDQYIVQMVENRAEDFSDDGETNINIALKKKFLSTIDSTFTLLGNDLILDANVVKQEESIDTKAALKLGKFDLQTLELVKENDTVAISVPNLFSDFIVLNNENAEEIARKLGFIEDSGDYYTASKDIESILNKYGKVLVKSINNYIDIKNNIEVNINQNTYTTKEYILALTEKDINQITINILEKLKDDEKTINLFLTYANLEVETLKENINNLYNELLEDIENIQNEEIILEVKLNVLDNKTIKTTIDFNKTFQIILLANQDEKNDYALLSLRVNDTILDLEYNGAKEEENYIGELELKSEDKSLTVLELNVAEEIDSTKTVRKITELNALLLNKATDEEIENLRKEIERNLGISEDNVEITIYGEGEFKVYNEDAIVKVLKPSIEAYNKIEIGMVKDKVIEIMGEPSAAFEVDKRENMGWYFDENNSIYFISVELTDGKISKVYNDITSDMIDNVQVSVELGTTIEDITKYIDGLKLGMTKSEVGNILGDKYLEISKDEEGYKTYKWYDKRENILVIEFDNEEKVSFVNEVTIDM